MAQTPTAQGRRLRRPSWRDARLLVGVLLVLLSVLIGSWLVAAAKNTTDVYAAKEPLLPGQEVTTSEVMVRAVQLDEALGAYITTSQGLQPGTYVLRAVQPGELVPSDSLGTAQEALDKTVSVPVDPAAASALRVGNIVDVWVSRRDPDEAGIRYLDPERLLERAIVAQVPTSGSGLSVGVGQAAVAIVIPAGDVGPIISSVDQEARITLVPAPGQTEADSS